MTFSLGDIAALNVQKWQGFDLPNTARVVTLLGTGPSVGKAVLQQGALTLRQAQISGVVTTDADLAYLRTYYETRSAETFTDDAAVEYQVRVLDLAIDRVMTDLWTYSATLLESSGASAWTAYTPVWLATATPADLGTGGVMTGRYLYDATSGHMDIVIAILLGTGFSIAAGPWTFSHPAPGGLTGLAAGGGVVESVRGDGYLDIVGDTLGTFLAGGADYNNALAWAAGDSITLRAYRLVPEA